MYSNLQKQPKEFFATSKVSTIEELVVDRSRKKYMPPPKRRIIKPLLGEHLCHAEGLSNQLRRACKSGQMVKSEKSSPLRPMVHNPKWEKTRPSYSSPTLFDPWKGHHQGIYITRNKNKSSANAIQEAQSNPKSKSKPIKQNSCANRIPNNSKFYVPPRLKECRIMVPMSFGWTLVVR